MGVKRKQTVDSVNMCIILLKHVRHTYELMLVSPHVTYLTVGTLCVSEREEEMCRCINK